LWLLRDPALEILPSLQRLVIPDDRRRSHRSRAVRWDAHPGRCWGAALLERLYATFRGSCRLTAPAIEPTQEGTQLVAGIKLAQAWRIRLRRHELLQGDGQLQIAVDGRQLACQLESLEPGAQVLTDLAAHLIHVPDEIVERPVLVEQLRRRLRAHLVDAGDVVGAVAHQREIVDDLLREDIELRLDPDAIEHGVA